MLQNYIINSYGDEPLQKQISNDNWEVQLTYKRIAQNEESLNKEFIVSAYIYHIFMHFLAFPGTKLLIKRQKL